MDLTSRLVRPGRQKVELRGLEPLTFSLRTRRATDCAIAPRTGWADQHGDFTTVRRRQTCAFLRLLLPSRSRTQSLEHLPSQAHHVGLLTLRRGLTSRWCGRWGA